MPRHSGCSTGNRAAAQNSAAGAIRNYRPHSGCSGRLDFACPSETRGQPVSEPNPRISPSLNSAICPSRGELGGLDRPGSFVLWDTLNAPNQADLDLSPDQESAGG